MGASQSRRSAATSTCILLSIAILNTPVNAVNFTECLAEVNSGKWGLTGGRDNHGNPVDISTATAVTYELCIRACGSGEESFSWSDFSQQFSAWLLPWLALVSQLPFGGSKDTFDNFSSIFLAVGSPTLAAYSLALTVLNERWLARRFGRADFPNVPAAVRILNNLQQVPLTINPGSLPSLVVLPDNDNWWKKLDADLDYTNTWSFAVAASISWVVIAFILTVTNSFTTDFSTIHFGANGQGVGSAWMWLLPIVIGWRQISPKCDRDRLQRAVNGANEIGYIAGEDGEAMRCSCAADFALSLSSPSSERSDTERVPPVYNFARFLYWLESAETVAVVFDHASDKAENGISVSGSKWLGSHLTNDDRRGNVEEVKRYCEPGTRNQYNIVRRPLNIWNAEILAMFFVASLFAMSLQWSTTGAAVVVFWLTPTKGLGCRSGAHLLYGGVSTIVWLLLVVSSTLAYSSSKLQPSNFPVARLIIRLLSVVLRRMGKILALLNAMWIVAICLFQFTNIFSNCWCNGSVLGLGTAGSYNVISITAADVPGMKQAWAGGIGLAAGCTVIFVWSISLFRSPLLSNSNRPSISV